jgi:hypothetical protein
MTLGGGAAADGAGIHNETTLTLNDIVIGYCISSTDGGGIWNSSTIILNDVSIIACQAAGGDGGGIWNSQTMGDLIGGPITNLDVSGCSSSGSGGGVFNDGSFYVTGGSIRTCSSASGDGGGGIWNNGTFVPIEFTIDLNSSATAGDGIWNGFGTVEMTRCAVSRHPNTVGIHNEFGTVELDNSTVSLNVGGILNVAGSVTLRHCTITNQTVDGLLQDPGALTDIFDTILAGNGRNDYDGDTADIFSSGHNIFGVCTNPITPAAGDQTVLTFAALGMGSLQNNGGPTETHALLAGSPAIDAGDNTGAPATDQRGTGYARVIDGTIDIGAYESDLNPEPPEPPTPPTPPAPPPPSPTPPGPTPAQGHHLAPCPIPLVPCFAPVLGVGETPGIPNLSSEAPDVDISTAVVHPPPWKQPPLEGGGGTIPGTDPPFVNPVTRDTEPDGPQPCTIQQFGLFGYTLGGGLNTVCNPNVPGPNSPPDIPNWPNPPQEPGQPPTPRRVFPNTEQSCDAHCADGTVFSFTVPANTYWDPSQRLADVMAQTYACKQAALQSICIAGSIGSGCRGTSYNEVISVSTQNPRSFTWSILGTLPPALSYVVLPGGGAIRITGTTTLAGSYAFTVLAVDANGVNVSRGYVVGVFSIDTVLPDGMVSSPYSQQITVTGAIASATFVLQSGALPAGMILSDDGLLFGTPLVDGSFHFVVAATTSGITCTKEYTLTIEPEPQCVDWSAPVVDINTTELGSPSGGYVSFLNRSSSFAADGFTYAVDEASNGSGGFTEANDSATQSYTGPGCTIRVTVNFSGTDNHIPNWFSGSKSVSVVVDCGVNLLSKSSGLAPGNMLPNVPNVFDVTIPECLVPTDVVVTFIATCSPSRQTVTASWQIQNI